MLNNDPFQINYLVIFFNNPIIKILKNRWSDWESSKISLINWLKKSLYSTKINWLGSQTLYKTYDHISNGRHKSILSVCIWLLLQT